ncbi:hypothetical protein BDV97DRAFT_395870 [Delphinella strobiligena]|nr:hypothetical protein BDV97DRAFT_395870 [Delphinella strobiligena]
MCITASLFISGAFAAVLHRDSQACPNLTCRKAFDACGNSYGGCYDACDNDFDIAFPSPKCTSTTLASAVPTTLTTSKVLRFVDPTITEAPLVELSMTNLTTTATNDTDVCIPKSVCVDYINSCYVRYGGCYDENTCDGQIVSFTPPACAGAAAATDGATATDSDDSAAKRDVAVTAVPTA